MSRSTTQLAYDQLLAEGLHYSRHPPGRGRFLSVCQLTENLLELAAARAAPARGRLGAERYREAEPEPGYRAGKAWTGRQLPAGSRRLAGMGSRSREQIPPSRRGSRNTRWIFHPAASTWTGFPSTACARRLSQRGPEAGGQPGAVSCGASRQGDLEPPGRPSADYLHAARGVHLSAADQVVDRGGERVSARCCSPEHSRARTRAIAMENPTYNQAYRVLQRHGASGWYPVEMDSQRASWPDRLQATPARDRSLCDAVPPVSHRHCHAGPSAAQELLSVGRRKRPGRYLHRGRLRQRVPLPGQSRSRRLQGMDRKGLVIYMGTFSKSIAPAIRIGYLVLPERAPVPVPGEGVVLFFYGFAGGSAYSVPVPFRRVF